MIQPGARTPAPPGLALIQDFINTADFEAGRDELERFRRDHGLRESLGELRALREALRDACQANAGADLPQDSLRLLNRSLGPLSLHLDSAGGVSLAATGGSFASRLAADIAVAFTDGTWRRLKACAADTCRWAYYDHSPAGRSRWCTMNLCGSREKMRRMRAKK